MSVQGQPGASEALARGRVFGRTLSLPPGPHPCRIHFFPNCCCFLFGFDTVGGYNFSLLLGMAFCQDSYLSGCYYAFLIVSLRGVQLLLVLLVTDKRDGFPQALR